MIRYALRCRNGHEFDSWFRSADGFEQLRSAGHVACPSCASREVEKALMAPQVRPARKAAGAAPETAGEAGSGPAVPAARGPLSPAAAREHALAELRRHIEASSEYVGLKFATEARRIHAGEAPDRRIHGEARLDEARALIEEGVPVAPLPFLPGKAN